MKKLVCLTAAILLIATMCNFTAFAAEEAPTPIRIFRPANVVDVETDPVIAELERRTNTDIEIITAPWDQCWNKLSMMMTSDEQLDLICADQTGTPWQTWAEEGLVYELGSMVTKERHPYLYSIMNSETFAPLMVNGGQYYVPGAHYGMDYSMYIRQDWLDALNMEKPTNTDEFYEMLKAFKYQNPEGLAPEEVYPYTVGQLIDFDPIAHAFGASLGGEWHDMVPDENGKLIPLFNCDNTKEALKYINRLYTEGLINLDFTDYVEPMDAYYKYYGSGHSGAIWLSRMPELIIAVNENAPQAVVEPLAPMDSPVSEFIPYQGICWWMVHGIPITCENPEKVLDFMEYCCSEEGRKLLVCGVEGVHYTEIVDGIYDQNREVWEKDFDVNINGYEYPLWWAFLGVMHGYVPVTEYDTFEEAYAHREIYVSAQDAATPYNYQTMVKNGEPYIESSPFFTTFLPGMSELYNKLDTDVLKVYFSRMIIAASEDEFNALWDEFQEMFTAYGGWDYVNAYQEFYDANLK